jgi:hypothetical protein
MKLNFNFNLLDLDSKEIEGANAGKLLANSLVNQSKGDALKFWEIALKLNNGEVIDLDTSDQNLLKTFIKDSETITILGKGQLLQLFEKSKS